MTLGFSTKWPDQMGELAGQPNYFEQKIWMGISCMYKKSISEIHPDAIKNLYEFYYDSHVHNLNSPWNITDSPIKPKITTIREDSNDRWKPEMDIHMVINNRTKDRFQFAPVMKCMRVQTFEIEEEIMTTYDCAKLKDGRVFTVKVDGKHLPFYRISELAWNDGFPSVEAFFNYFNTDFKGKIIHWTDLNY